MSRLVLIAVVLVALLALVAVVAGCPRTPAPVPPTVTPTVPPPGAESPAPTTVTPTAPTGEMGAIVTAHDQVRNYNVTIKVGDKTVMTTSVKADAGKPTALRVTTGGGYLLVLPGEQTQYLLNKAKQTATKQALGKKGEGYLGKLPSPMALAAKNPTITTEKLGETDCWRLEWTNDKAEKVQMWLDKKYGLPQKAVHGKVVTRYKYEKIDQVPESTFTVPPGYKKKELTTTAPTATPSTGTAVVHGTPAPPSTSAAPAPAHQPAPPHAAGTTAPAPGLTPAR